VTYATSEQFAARIVRAGAQYVLIPSMDFAGRQDDLACHTATETVKAVTPSYETDRPDLIIYDLIAMAGRVLAHQWNLPAIKISPDFAYSEEAFSCQVRQEKVRELGCELSRKADHFLRRYGILSSGYMFHREKLNIHLCPRNFDPNGHVADESCLYAGRCPGEQFPVGDWRNDFGEDRSIAAIVPSTFSRDAQYVNLCVEALSELPWNFVLFLPPDMLLTSPLLLPDNFRAIRGSSASNTLSNATMLVCMGGAMTVAEGIYHGLPLLMTSCGVPFFETLCDRWVELGLGRHLKHTEMRAEGLRGAFIEVIESAEIRAKVRRMQRLVQCEPGAEEVANGIEEFIGRYCA
jgi:MGT family glycosyltransferase